MSYLLVDRVLSMPGSVIDCNHKLALATLARFAKDDGADVYPAIATVAELVGLSVKQTRRIVHDLVAAGWLIVEWEGGGRRPNTESGRRRGAATEYLIDVAKVMQTLPPTGGLRAPVDNPVGFATSTLPSDAPNPPKNGANPPIQRPETLPPVGAESVIESFEFESLDRNAFDKARKPVLKKGGSQNPTPPPETARKRPTRIETEAERIERLEANKQRQLRIVEQAKQRAGNSE